MPRPKLTYFDAPISRGEECRLALTIAGVEFDDVRLARDAWLALKPSTPFGSVPIFEIPGEGVLAQSNAILTLIGRRHDLHPEDDFEAARHEAMMQHVEDLRAALGPSMRMSDEAEKKKAREVIVATTLPTWAASVEKQIAGPFFAGDRVHVVDLKLFVVVVWLSSGKLDHVPASIFEGHPKLLGLHAAVRDHERVKAWYAKA
ncbi:MAG: glutathione S-transferase [Labilithrix sp.]|nr:glutathione S-transferase [Labilithrix sp.]